MHFGEDFVRNKTGDIFMIDYEGGKDGGKPATICQWRVNKDAAMQLVLFSGHVINMARTKADTSEDTDCQAWFIEPSNWTKWLEMHASAHTGVYFKPQIDTIKKPSNVTWREHLQQVKAQAPLGVAFNGFDIGIRLAEGINRTNKPRRWLFVDFPKWFQLQNVEKAILDDARLTDVHVTTKMLGRAHTTWEAYAKASPDLDTIQIRQPCEDVDGTEYEAVVRGFAVGPRAKSAGRSTWRVAEERNRSYADNATGTWDVYNKGRQKKDDSTSKQDTQTAADVEIKPDDVPVGADDDDDEDMAPIEQKEGEDEKAFNERKDLHEIKIKKRKMKSDPEVAAQPAPKVTKLELPKGRKRKTNTGRGDCLFLSFVQFMDAKYPDRKKKCRSDKRAARLLGTCASTLNNIRIGGTERVSKQAPLLIPLLVTLISI